MRSKVTQGMKQREKQAERNLNYLHEENEKRKEIRQLHKLDQIESYNRGKNFHMMYK